MYTLRTSAILISGFLVLFFRFSAGSVDHYAPRQPAKVRRMKDFTADQNEKLTIYGNITSFEIFASWPNLTWHYRNPQTLPPALLRKLEIQSVSYFQSRAVASWHHLRRPTLWPHALTRFKLTFNCHDFSHFGFSVLLFYCQRLLTTITTIYLYWAHRSTKRKSKTIFLMQGLVKRDNKGLFFKFYVTA